MNIGSPHPGDEVVRIADAAGRGSSFERQFATSALPRTSALLAAAAADSVGGNPGPSDVAAIITFSPARSPALAGVDVSVDGELSLLCQRCLELVSVNIAQRTSLLLVPSETNDDVVAESGQAGERWDHDAETLVLAELIDELVVLGLPMIVRHDDPLECGPLSQGGPTTNTEKSGATQTQKPFAALASLMRDGGKD